MQSIPYWTGYQDRSEYESGTGSLSPRVNQYRDNLNAQEDYWRGWQEARQDHERIRFLNGTWVQES